MVLPDSNGVPRAPPYSGAPRVAFGFRYRTVTAYGEAFQPLLLPNRKSHFGVLQPHSLESAWFGLFPFRSPLLGESRLISSPAGTEMFHFPALASTNLFIQFVDYGTTPVGLPHSDIPGSSCVWPLPEAYRSLPRLSSPISAKASACCPYLLVLLRLSTQHLLIVN